MDIVEVAQRSGIPASTLRYYEQMGLIASRGRRGLRRLFDPRVLTKPYGKVFLESLPDAKRFIDGIEVPPGEDGKGGKRKARAG